MDNRHTIILKLINFEDSTEKLKNSLKSFAWDYEGPRAELNCEHLCKVIQRYLDGDLTSYDIEEWANLIEGREDITFDLSNKVLLQDIVNELANPELTIKLSEKRGKEIIHLLSESESSEPRKD
ncbi:hypothetical protein FH581_017495 (plasmid) [Leptospira weilii]|uniref:hypothetical protein n=1 Tax=Leptospira weilii TaxID=28184 RepID=UPI001EF300A2|nr:hypothetical protein [Leptospira weilii]ULH30700.1 hypothetical protein FH586_21415 [Leptospira weilii]ULH30713.1 hypothetical protein FH586_21490 [Leptospira weilii]ULH30724.1 hypothetical protein FH586_21565 [Leptospira weilii]ULH30762.1 hypothetical protein FH586_21795 [Leptospira weilii]UPY80941.1 hypothetical protein FH581_017495 [Leptospira weilii]